MTVTVGLPIAGLGPIYSNYEYIAWCHRNLFVPEKPRSWKIIYDYYVQGKYTQAKIIFLNEEDALAFKLTFGL